MNQNNPQVIKAAVIVVIVAGLLGALTIMTEGIGIGSAKIFAICLALIIYGITATICMVVTRKPECRSLGNAGMVVSASAFLLVFIITVGEVGDEGLLKFAFALFIASIALAHICLLHNFNLQNKYALYARITGTIAIAVFSLVLIVRIFEPFAGMSALMYNQSSLNLIVAALVIDLAATLLVPLCNRLEVQGPVQELPAIPAAPETPAVVEEQTPVE